MNIDQKILDQFAKLQKDARSLLARESESDFELDEYGRPCVGDVPASGTALQYQWGTSCLSLIKKVFGDDSDHYLRYNEMYSRFYNAEGFNSLGFDGIAFHQAIGILASAKDDYVSGFLFDLKTRITADVFDDFLEQAEYLLKAGFDLPAAVIAGAVLEDGLRKLCARYDEIELPDKPKLDTMNGQLAKVGAYSKLTQKRITALADIRNSAAHGEREKFEKSDVEKMIPEVREFMERHF